MRFNSTDKCVSDGPRERAVPLASFEFSRNVVCVVGAPPEGDSERMKHVNGVSLLWGVYAGCLRKNANNTVCFSR